ncbi:MAG: deoxyribonuclease IV [Candidatus Pacebacteria bacterium]|nr:deoxyribonuclease IV [Candidatus Paceibacterota bacterium]
MSQLIGAHVSTAGGTEKAMKRASDIGANAIQIFSGSPRFWKRKKLSEIPTDKLFSEQKQYAVKEIYIHALYLANLATDKPELVEKSVNALKYDLSFSSHIKAKGVIVHVGSHQGRGWESVRNDVANRIKEILDDTPKDSIFLIENSAGQKGKVNSDLSEIRWLIDTVGSKRLKWCLDTCHGFSAGYALSKDQQKKYKETSNGLITDEITKYKLWNDLVVIHVNDSKGKFDGGTDRHENLGEGNITSEAFKEFLSHPQVKKKPLLLEVPGLAGNGPDSENIERLQELVK